VTAPHVPGSGTGARANAPAGADVGRPTVLVLVRHGRTRLTEQRRFSGRGGADPALSAAGRGDAAAVAALLATPGALPDVGPVEHLVCSPLARTRGTAAIMGERVGLVPEPDDAWAELGFGAWDGLTYDEIAARWPDQLRAWQGSVTVAPPGGESLADLAGRVRAARAALVAAHPGRTVAVVTHVTPVRVVVQEALDAGPSALWRTRIAPCSVTAVRYWQDGGVEVLAVNVGPAVPAEPGDPAGPAAVPSGRPTRSPR